jgi:hypothetical protein
MDSKQHKMARSESNEPARVFYVVGFSLSDDSRDVGDYFERFGTVCHCKVEFERGGGASRGYAFVAYNDSVVVPRKVVMPGSKHVSVMPAKRDAHTPGCQDALRAPRVRSPRRSARRDRSPQRRERTPPRRQRSPPRRERSPPRRERTPPRLAPTPFGGAPNALIPSGVPSLATAPSGPPAMVRSGPPAMAMAPIGPPAMAPIALSDRSGAEVLPPPSAPPPPAAPAAAPRVTMVMLPYERCPPSLIKEVFVTIVSLDPVTGHCQPV